jgi:mRNA deadenylase 3'-5' endonuclease subunit Ccr4
VKSIEQILRDNVEEINEDDGSLSLVTGICFKYKAVISAAKNAIIKTDPYRRKVLIEQETTRLCRQLAREIYEKAKI